MDSLLNLDKSLLIHINSVWTHPWMDALFPTITDLHKQFWFQLIFVPLILALFIWKFRKTGIYIFLCLALAMGASDMIGNRLIKKNVQRLRPHDALGDVVIVRSPYGGFSFTSNHAANMFCLARFTSEFIPQATIPFYAAATLVAYSRVYNGVHYPTDVAGGGLLGWFVGAWFSWLCQWGFRQIRKRPML